MPFNNLLDVATAVAETGNEWQSFFWKTGGPNPGAGRWLDTSVGAGIPIYNPYAGSALEATPMIGAGNRGIYTGPEPSAGQTKHLFAMQAGTAGTGVPLYLLLADYLMFYPLVDGDSTDTQDLDNTATLPRSVSGEGVRCMAVVAAPMVQSGVVTMTYTNSDGVANRTSKFGLPASGTIGTLATSSSNAGVIGAVSPFAPLASGDKGIRSIESIVMDTAPGGLLNFVLVKPIAHQQVREINTQAEKFLFRESATLPKIESGAYLSFLANNGASATYTPLRGFLQFIWR